MGFNSGFKGLMKWSDSREARNVCWELNKDPVYLTGFCQHFGGESEQTEGKLTFWLHNFNPTKLARLVIP
jgi:hypothetical protein